MPLRYTLVLMVSRKKRVVTCILIKERYGYTCLHLQFNIEAFSKPVGNFRSPGKDEDDDIHAEISEAARKLAEIEKRDREQQTDNSLLVHFVDIVCCFFLVQTQRS